MAGKSDHGDYTDVHPKEKKPIGGCLALIAWNNLYDIDVEWQSKLVNNISIDDNKIMLGYSHAERFLTSDENLLPGFEVAGSDEIFYPAIGRIKGNIIELVAEEVSHPRSFRYGYTPFTDANLINESLLPASTFSSAHYRDW